MLELDDLHMFIRVVEKGGISAAARSMDAPKSSVSRSLSRLEARIGAKLLERSDRNFRLTEAGTLLLPHARRVVEAVDAAENDLSSMRGTLRGVLRVRATYSLSQAIIAPMLPTFLSRYPAISVWLVGGSRVGDIIADNADVVIAVGSPGRSSPEGTVLASVDLWTCASPAYLGRRGTPKLISDLAKHDLLGVREPMRWSFTKHDGEVTSFDFVPRVVASEPATAEAIIAGGLAIGRLPDYLARAAVARGSLLRLFGELVGEKVEVRAVAPRGVSFSVKANAFIEAFTARLTSMQ